MSDPSSTAPRPGAAGGADPSMEDILASIRRILNEGEPGETPHPHEPETPPKDDVLVLDPSMIVDEPQEPSHPPAEPEPPPMPSAERPARAPTLVAPEAAASAASAVSALVSALAAERSTPVYRGGPTIEDLVRDELRPLLKAWLDQHLPPLVERLVRAEIERVVGRAAP